MTFTVTPQPNNVPPRVRIDIDSDDAAKPFTSLTISRNGSPLREQPFVGSSEALLFDYEAPFGAPVTYSASGAVGTFNLVYGTTWPNLTGWTTWAATPSVASSYLVTGGVQRDVTLTTATGRLVFAAPFSAGSGSLKVGSWLTVQRLGGGGGVTVTFGGSARTIGYLSGPLTITWEGTRVSVRTNQTSVEFQGGPATAGVHTVRADARAGTVPRFDLLDRSATAPFAATATTTLNVVDTWLIHPSQPSLSVPIYSHESSAGVRYIEASSGEQKSSKAVSTVHRPIGRKRPVVITSGPRQADEWTLVVESETIAAKNALRAIVDDQTPLLLRSPASVVMDLPDDWYSVGDVTVQRLEVPVITEATQMTMPLTPVDEPVVRVGALWTWGDVLTTYVTWQDVLDDNATWLDVLAGPSS
jgi:hypothetical protein